MLTSDTIATARMLQVTGSSTSVPDTTAVEIATANANRFRLRITVSVGAVFTVATAPAIAIRHPNGVIRLHTFGPDELTVELCALEYGSAVFGPILGIGSSTGAVVFYVTSVALNQEPVS